MIGYYLSFVLQKGMKDRLQRLERAAENHTKPDPAKSREEKIRRYRVEKECEKRLAEIKMIEVDVRDQRER